MKRTGIILILLILVKINAYSQGKSVNFDGVNDYIKILNNQGLQSSASMTVEAWINSDIWKDQLHKGTIVSNGNSTNGNNGFDLRAAENGKAEFNIAIGGIWYSVATPEIMTAGKWYHIAGVFTGDSIQIYINGFLRNAVTVTGTISTFNKDLYLGACPGWTGRNFDGRIDEVRYWNIPKTQSEIKNSICSQLAGNEAGLLGYWKLDDGSGNQAADATGNGFNGTLTAMSISTCWVNNYICSVLNPDIGITKIISPQTSEGLTNAEQVTVEITNFSMNNSVPFQISYQLNNNQALTENISNIIPGFSSMNYTFAQAADLSDSVENILELTVTMQGDSNASNNSLTNIVTSYNPGSNLSLNFDGVNDEVLINNSASLNPTGNALTVEAWIMAFQWKDQVYQGTIVGKVEGSPDRGYNLGAGAGGIVEFQISDNGSWNGVQTMPVLKTGRWYHVAGVYDGSTLKIYVNGKLMGTKSAGAISNSTCNLMIGECPSWGGGRNFSGRIDEVRIWNYARSESEINSNLDENLTGNETGLIAYWNFNHFPNANTVEDLSPGNYNGTIGFMSIPSAIVFGYALTNNDIGISEIISPSSGPVFSQDSRIKVKIFNYGFNEVTSFQAAYSINNGTAQFEQVSDTIKPFSSITYYFSRLANISGMSECNIKAFTSFQLDSDNTNDTLSTTIRNADSVVIFNRVQHNFAAAGQTHSRTAMLPENYDNISQIVLHYKLDCPATGCDPWDQTGKISVITADGQDIEIGRFMTPFGVACGPWSIDITDFKSILTGSVNFKSYIQAWGASGWLFTMWIELIEGTPSKKYSKIDRLWNTDYQVYGDPNISYDLPVKNVQVHAMAENIKIRMTTTGHGQGNTQNAAEFYYPTHSILINGTNAFSQHLYRECNTNPCQPQNGTWIYERAGWCPGSNVIPDEYNLQQYATPGANISIDYILESYTNLQNTGYNGSSHTEPFYRIHSFLVTESNNPLSDITDAGITNIISPVVNNGFISTIVKNFGNVPLSNFYISYYINSSAVISEYIQQTILPGETQTITFSQPADIPLSGISDITVIVSKSGDMNSSNDFKKLQIITGIEKQYKDEISIIPNPASDYIEICTNNDIQYSEIIITDIGGKVIPVNNLLLSKTKINLSGLQKGVYFISIHTQHGLRREMIIKL